MDIFEYIDFRDFLRDFLKAMPKRGHGQAKKLAEAVGISSAFFSQILAQKRQLSLEQGVLIAEFFGLNEIQTEYFLALIQLDRAGNETLKRQIQRQISRLRKNSKSVATRFTSVAEVSDADKPIYYSDWTYSAIHQSTAILQTASAHEIAQYLDLPPKKVKDILTFLTKAGLCIEKNGRIEIGPARIHLSVDSPWIKQHHTNWRIRALENVNNEEHRKLHYSSPMTLSSEDFEKVRSILVTTIEKIAKTIDPSPSEELICLNIDWFRVAPAKNPLR